MWPQPKWRTIKQKKLNLTFYIIFIHSHIDTENFPFTQWRKYVKNTIDEAHHDLLLHGESQGELILRREIAHYLYHARGVKCTPEQIVVGAGAEILLQQLFLLFDERYGLWSGGSWISPYSSNVTKSTQMKCIRLK